MELRKRACVDSPPGWVRCGRGSRGRGADGPSSTRDDWEGDAAGRGTHLAIYHHSLAPAAHRRPQGGAPASRAPLAPGPRAAQGRPAAGLMARPPVPAGPRLRRRRRPRRSHCLRPRRATGRSGRAACCAPAPAPAGWAGPAAAPPPLVPPPARRRCEGRAPPRAAAPPPAGGPWGWTPAEARRAASLRPRARAHSQGLRGLRGRRVHRAPPGRSTARRAPRADRVLRTRRVPQPPPLAAFLQCP